MLEFSATQVVGVLIAGLIAVAGFLIKEWKNDWETRIVAIDERLDGHRDALSYQQVLNATITTKLEHIEEKTDTTSKDVKELLKQNGTKRNTGGR